MLAADAGGVTALAVALSGGRDSIALLDALVRATPARGIRLAAIHVHHGWSVHADAWAAFCAETCARLGVTFALRCVQLSGAPRRSLEADARRARYAAMVDAARELGIATIALAHHQDDQAESLLLQLGRGAGPRGLAAMAAARHDGGILWLRPLLDLPRKVIDEYIRMRGLAHVDDDSNASPRHRRNALRQSVIPAIAAVLPGYPATLARAARWQAEASQLLDELAAIDAGNAFDGTTLERAALVLLAPPRARNLLRWFLRQHDLAAPSSVRLDAMLGQLRGAKPDARVRLAHAGYEIGLHRGRVMVHAPLPAPYECAWNGESRLALPHGTLAFVTAHGEGISTARLAAEGTVVRMRGGGERLQLDAGRPRRALKSLLQAAGVPPWERASLPLVWCGDALAAVPGIGVDVAFRAGIGEAGVRVEWLPGAARRGQGSSDGKML